jgi:hypothetical protein
MCSTGRIEPGRVFDRTRSRDGVPGGYRLMNDRESIKFRLEFWGASSSRKPSTGLVPHQRKPASRLRIASQISDER